MLYQCDGLVELYVMLYQCDGLVELYVMLYQCDGLVELYKAGSKRWQVATLYFHKASETKGDKRMTEIM